MAQEPIEAMEQRDRAMQKLHDLTWACFMWAAGLVAVFSVIAAVTLPGQTQNSSGTTAGSDPSNSAPSVFTDDGGQLQPPANGSFQGGGGSPPLAVSGGSH
jgi:hypothetical protein